MSLGSELSGRCSSRIKSKSELSDLILVLVEKQQKSKNIYRCKKKSPILQNLLPMLSETGIGEPGLTQLRPRNSSVRVESVRKMRG